MEVLGKESWDGSIEFRGNDKLVSKEEVEERVGEVEEGEEGEEEEDEEPNW